jgi:hypothetical protein
VSAEVLLGDGARLRLQRPLGSARDLAVDEPRDRDTGAEKHDTCVKSETEHEPGPGLVARGAYVLARVSGSRVRRHRN